MEGYWKTMDFGGNSQYRSFSKTTSRLLRHSLGAADGLKSDGSVAIDTFYKHMERNMHHMQGVKSVPDLLRAIEQFIRLMNRP